MSLIAPGSRSAHNQFSAKLYLLSRGEGGRKKPISQKFIMPLFSRSWSVPSRIDVKDGAMLMPGEIVFAFQLCLCVGGHIEPNVNPSNFRFQTGEAGEVTLTLSKKMPLFAGQSFTIREHGVTVASGVVTKVNGDVRLSSTQLAKNTLQ